MGARTIRRDIKADRRERRRVHQRLAAGPSSFVTVVRDQATKEILGVLVDRGAYDRFKDRSKLDLSQAELIDFELGI